MKIKVINKWLHRVALEHLVWEKQISEKKTLFVTEVFFLFVNLSTASFIIGLHLNYLIHYLKRYVTWNHFKTGVISGYTCNFWQKCRRDDLTKWRFNHEIGVLSAVSHSVMFQYHFNSAGTHKKISQYLLHVHFMERLNEISSRETNVFL